KIEVLKGQIQQKEDIDHFGRCLLFVNGPQFKLKRLVLQWPLFMARCLFYLLRRACRIEMNAQLSANGI
ncbi:hypothetical protein, partial [Paenibacillus alginolyticus]|uniref:hypothetical protein n=1 Tax=Paenibacillus alginolyticus TaxID=59839 RepID=UPI001C27931B